MLFGFFLINFHDNRNRPYKKYDYLGKIIILDISWWYSNVMMSLPFNNLIDHEV